MTRFTTGALRAAAIGRTGRGDFGHAIDEDPVEIEDQERAANQGGDGKNWAARIRT